MTIQASRIELYDNKSGDQTNGVGKIYFTIQARVPIPIKVLAYSLDKIEASIAMILETYATFQAQSLSSLHLSKSTYKAKKPYIPNNQYLDNTQSKWIYIYILNMYLQVFIFWAPSFYHTQAPNFHSMFKSRKKTHCCRVFYGPNLKSNYVI